MRGVVHIIEPMVTARVAAFALSVQVPASLFNTCPIVLHFLKLFFF